MDDFINVADCPTSINVARATNHLIRFDTGASPYCLSEFDHSILVNSNKNFIKRDHKGFFLRNAFKTLGFRHANHSFRLFDRRTVDNIKIKESLIVRVRELEVSWKTKYSMNKIQ